MIDIEWSAHGVDIEPEARELIEKAVCASYERLHTGMRAEVGIRITTDEEIRFLNRTYRHIDAATDVLSFPMARFDAAHQPVRYEVNPKTRAVLLGDMVLSLERAKAQAREYGHSDARELAYLSVHAMLHLAGHDHMQQEEKALMRAEEEAILTPLCLTREDASRC